MNKIILIGNLTRDPETGTTQNGVSFTRFNMAVNRLFTNAAVRRGGGRDRVSYAQVGKLARGR